MERNPIRERKHVCKRELRREALLKSKEELKNNGNKDSDFLIPDPDYDSHRSIFEHLPGCLM